MEHMNYQKTINLFENNEFYEEFDPIIVFVKNGFPYVSPIGYINNNENITHFIIERASMQLLEKSANNPSISNNANIQNNFFNISNFSHSYDENPREQIFDIIKSNPEQIPVYQFTPNDQKIKNIWFSAGQQINKICLKAIENKKMDLQTFIDNAEPAKISNNDIYYILKKGLKYNLEGLEYINFIKSITEHKYCEKEFLANAIETQKFTPGWLYEADEIAGINIINMIGKLPLSVIEKNEIKAHLLEKFLIKNETYRISPLAINHIFKLPEEEQIYICDKLKKTIISGKNVGTILKQTLQGLKEATEEDKPQEIIKTFSYTLEIPWQKISFEQFPNVKSRSDTLLIYPEKALTRNQINQVYEAADVPVLMQIISYLEMAEYKIAESINSSTNFNTEMSEKNYNPEAKRVESNNIFLKGNKLFYRTYTPETVDKEHIKLIVNDVAASISRKTLESFSFAEMTLDCILLKNKINNTPLPKDNYESSEHNMDNNFKI